MSILNRTALATALLAAAPLAVAATAPTDTMIVTMTIKNSCTLEVTQDMKFDATNLDSAAVAQGILHIDCTSPNAGFTVGLNAGLHGGGDVNARKMSTTDGKTIDYQLYTESSHSTVWGDGATVPGFSGASTPTAEGQNLIVYGEVPAQTAIPVGDYSDSITATVTF